MLFPGLCQGPCLPEAPDLPGHGHSVQFCQACKHASRALHLWLTGPVVPQPLAQVASTLAFMTGTYCRQSCTSHILQDPMGAASSLPSSPEEHPGCQWLLTMYVGNLFIRYTKTFLCECRKAAMQKHMSALTQVAKRSRRLLKVSMLT